jgi:Bax protein
LLKASIGLILAASLYAGELRDFGPAYQKIANSKAKKQAFTAILMPKINKANEAILNERAYVEAFFSKSVLTNNAFDREEIDHLARIAKKYRIKNLYDKKSYLRRIDVVPASMVLAQAAMESAWGKSRFAVLANNIFGEWTYGKNGIVPADRPKGMRHKIRKFKDLEDSVEAYMLNLNRHRAYRKFRNVRNAYRLSGKRFTGMDGAKMMENYSAIGKKYTQTLQKMIVGNKWQQYDRHTFMLADARL